MAGSRWSWIAGSNLAFVGRSTLHLDSAPPAGQWMGTHCSARCRCRVDGAARTRAANQRSGTATR